MFRLKTVPRWKNRKYMSARALTINAARNVTGSVAKPAKWIAALCGIAALLGAFSQTKQFAYSYLLAFMFFLSLCLGALFLVLVHHMFDSGWSVPIRRFLEHQAFLLPIMAILFIPLAILAPTIYPWMQMGSHPDHALHAKEAYLNVPFFYFRAALYFLIWGLLSYRLRYWSLKQDRTGDAESTQKMRRLAAGGIFLFAITLTFAAIDWMKSLQHQWFSTMYGVYYFAGSVWVTLATAYLTAVWLKRTGPLAPVVHQRQFNDIGVLMLAFTVFYAYIHFSQYLIIWNANLPEETFWYVQREKGTWWDAGLLLVFGHFLIPFLLLLRIDVKTTWPVMIPLCMWAWAMRYVDLSFNIMPVLHPDGFTPHWLDLACIGFIGGTLATVFFKYLNGSPIWPLKDPRLKESQTVNEIPPPAIAESVHEEYQKD
jgi:hypothetical protein